MKTSSRSLRSALLSKLSATVLSLGAVASLGQSAKADVTYTSWHLNPLSEASFHPSYRPSAWENGIIKIIEKRADSKGGLIRVSVQEGTPNTKAREYTLSWAFSQDVTYVNTTTPIVVTVNVTGNANANAMYAIDPSINPTIYPAYSANGRDNVQADQWHQAYHFKNDPKVSPTNVRKIGQPGDNHTSAYGFSISLGDFTRAPFHCSFQIDYNYTGMQPTTAPVTVSPMANTPTYFYISSGSNYYTFTKSGNTVIENLWNSTSKWTLTYYGQGTLNNVGHGVMMTVSGYYYFIPDINATGSMSKQLFVYAGNNSWNSLGQMQALR